MAAVDREARSELTIEIATVMLENAIMVKGLYDFGSLWSIGPRNQLRPRRAVPCPAQHQRIGVPSTEG